MISFFQNKWLHFEDRLKQLENDLNKHHDEVGEIKQVIKVLVPAPNSTTSSNKKTKGDNLIPNAKPNNHKLLPSSEMLYQDSCPFQIDNAPRTDIQVKHWVSFIFYCNMLVLDVGLI